MTKLRYRFFLIFITVNTYVLLIFHAKIQPKISSGSGEETGFVIFAIFSILLVQFYNSETLVQGQAPCKI